MKVNLDKYLLKVEKPAQYLGNEINSIHKKDFKSKMCLFFPDIYEVGMSNLGIRILYTIMNRVDDFSLERGFSPMEDMEKIMRDNDIPMFSLESKTPLREFDVVGFSLSYEMCYPNVLNALDLAKIPFRSSERDESYPLIMAGGTCMMNPVPVERFFDFIVIGDGEEVMPQIAKLLVENRDRTKDEKLQILGELMGVYVPKFHKNKKIIKRAIVRDLNSTQFYDNQIVPYMAIVHDRATVEIQRGCSRGCRFCQAGIVYRPVRERSLENNLHLINKMIKNTGYVELSLSSLSSSDYSQIDTLIGAIKNSEKNKNLAISLPSLRMNTHSVEVAEDISGGKRTGFTFAPEAGSQRMRDVINKGVTEQDIMDTAIRAVNGGWENLKFYFMVGLPFETDDDVVSIHTLVKKVVSTCRAINKRANITVSVSNFVPKPHTPFEWCEQIGFSEMSRRHKILKELFNGEKGCDLKIHDKKKSFLEGNISRGDERTSDLIELAFKYGAKLDDYRDNSEIWFKALSELNFNEDEYLKARDLDATLPWDFVDTGVDKSFLLREYNKAQNVLLTPGCLSQCSACGMNKNFKDCMKSLRNKEQNV